MINYACSKCRTAMASPDGAAGQVNKCPACGQGITVPPAAARKRRAAHRSLGKHLPATSTEGLLNFVGAIFAVLAFVSFIAGAVLLINDQFERGVILFFCGIALIGAAILYSAFRHVLLYLRTIANGGRGPAGE